jgi:RNA polymerase sigma-70 factor (ECF subfamily)
MEEPGLLQRARAGDDRAFEELVAPYRAQLHAHCYRMLASAHDADDALQDALIGAWRGIGSFEGRSSLRGWLYRIATNAALRIGARRPRRQLSLDVAPACTDPHAWGEPLDASLWVEPYPAERVDALSVDPATAYDAREAVELAFVAALQHLPASQRAVLLLRDVLALSSSETAETLDLSVAAANSQLQRARATLARRLPDRTQQSIRAELGTDAEQRLVADLVAAWHARDVEAFVALLVDDARLSMPPLPAWFDGVESVRGFLARMFQTPWRLEVTSANAQPALVCWQGRPDGMSYHPGGLTVLTLHAGGVAGLTCFLAPLVEDFFAATDDLGPPLVS